MTPLPLRPARAVRVRALAKINLHLEVLGRRPDGYHDLVTVFQSVDLADTVSIEAHDGPFALQCAAVGVPADETNLAWRAAAALAREWGEELPRARMILDKVVPSQAGLGGGSADAVAAMRALACWRGHDVTPDMVRALGRTLGADVPFFVEGGTALGIGRGDELMPLPDLPPHGVVLVRPDFGVGTADAYAWIADARAASGARDHDPRRATWPERSEEWRARLGTLRNDFEPGVGARHPDIPRIVSALREGGAVSSFLCGSGSAVAGLFVSSTAASVAAASLDRRASWRIWVTETVDRAAYARAVAPRVR